MPTIRKAQQSATFGVVSPRLEGRDNLTPYAESLRASLNFLVLPQGCLQNRSGTKFIAAAKSGTADLAFIPFEFSVDQSYLIELGDAYARFFVPTGRLEVSSTPVEITTPWAAAQARYVAWAQEGNQLFLTHSSKPPQILTRTSATTFAIAPIAWRNGRAPMGENNVDAAQTLTLSGSAPNFTLTASAPVRDFTVDDVGRYVRMSNSTVQRWFKITAVPSTTTLTVTVADELSAAPFTSATDDWSLGVTSDTQGFATVAFYDGRCHFGGAPNYPDQVWSSNSDDFLFFEERDAAGSTDGDNRAFTRRCNSNQGNSILWMQPTATRLAVGTSGGEFSLEAAEDAILTNASARMRPATAYGSAQVFPVVADGEVLFTQSGGRQIRRAGFDLTQDAYAAEELSILSENLTRSGVVRMSAAPTPSSAVWVQRADGVMVALTLVRSQKVLNFTQHTIGGAFNGAAAQVVASAVTAPVDGANIVWVAVRRTIGGSTVTYVEQLQPVFDPGLDSQSTQADRVAATEHAWFLDSALQYDTPFTITAATKAAPCAITTSAAHGLSTGDRVRIRDMRGLTSLNRKRFTVTVTGTTTFTLDDTDTTADGTYIASTGNARQLVTSVSGLDHLEGQTVSILGDGAELPTAVVSSGNVAFSREISIALVGILPDAFFETQRFFSEFNGISSQGIPSRIQTVTLRLLNSLGLSVGAGPQPGTLEPIETRKPDATMDEALPLFSGDATVAVNASGDTEPTVFVRQSSPLPACVLSIYPKMEVNLV